MIFTFCMGKTTFQCLAIVFRTCSVFLLVISSVSKLRVRCTLSHVDTISQHCLSILQLRAVIRLLSCDKSWTKPVKKQKKQNKSTHTHTSALCVTKPRPALSGWTTATILGGARGPRLQGPFYWVKCLERALICRCWHGGRRRFSMLPRQAATWELSGRLLIQERQPNEWIPEGAGGITAAASIEKVGRIIHLFIICGKKRINWNSI